MQTFIMMIYDLNFFWYLISLSFHRTRARAQYIPVDVGGALGDGTGDDGGGADVLVGLLVPDR